MSFYYSPCIIYTYTCMYQYCGIFKLQAQWKTNLQPCDFVQSVLFVVFQTTWLSILPISVLKDKLETLTRQKKGCTTTPISNVIVKDYTTVKSRVDRDRKWAGWKLSIVSDALCRVSWHLILFSEKIMFAHPPGFILSVEKL